jgi:hypothetical protein
MRADLETQPERISPHHFVDPVGGNGVVQPAGAVIADRTEEGAFGVGRMARLIEIVIEERLGAGVQGDESRFAALAMDPQVWHTAPRVDVLDLQFAEFLPAQPVVKQGREQGAVPEAFEALFVWQIHELPSLLIRDRRRLALVAVDFRSFHALDGVGRDRVLVRHKLIKRRQGRHLAPNGSRGQLPAVQVLAPGDDMGSGNEPEFGRRPDRRERHELFQVIAVRSPRVHVVDVGEPFGFRRNVGELRKLRAGQRASRQRNGLGVSCFLAIIDALLYIR